MGAYFRVIAQTQTTNGIPVGTAKAIKTYLRGSTQSNF